MCTTCNDNAHTYIYILPRSKDDTYMYTTRAQHEQHAHDPQHPGNHDRDQEQPESSRLIPRLTPFGWRRTHKYPLLTHVKQVLFKRCP